MACPIGNKTVPAGYAPDSRTPNKFYKPMTISTAMLTAKARCINEGADLPNLDTQGEFEVIRDYESLLNIDLNINPWIILIITLHFQVIWLIYGLIC